VHSKTAAAGIPSAAVCSVATGYSRELDLSEDYGEELTCPVIKLKAGQRELSI
jgi:hypothetical protein